MSHIVNAAVSRIPFSVEYQTNSYTYSQAINVNSDDVVPYWQITFAWTRTAAAILAEDTDETTIKWGKLGFWWHTATDILNVNDGNDQAVDDGGEDMKTWPRHPRWNWYFDARAAVNECE